MADKEQTYNVGEIKDPNFHRVDGVPMDEPQDIIARAKELLDKATPEPWYVRYVDDWGYYKIKTRATTPDWNGDIAETHTAPNAELIAAAPELIRGLVESAEFWQNEYNLMKHERDTWCERAEEARTELVDTERQIAELHLSRGNWKARAKAYRNAIRGHCEFCSWHGVDETGETICADPENKDRIGCWQFDYDRFADEEGE